MPAIMPRLDQGSLPPYYAMLWEQIYIARFANFGTTTTIIPLVDSGIGRINATAHNTKRTNASGQDQVVTHAIAPSAFDTPFALEPAVATWSEARLHGPAGIPFLLFNGTDERATIPDAAYWTRALAAHSVVACGYFVATTGRQTIIAKDDEDVNSEWSFHLTASETVQLEYTDESATATIDRASDAAIPLLVPVHLAVTMDTGATMANAVIYVNGASVASTAGASGVFVSMEDLAAVVSIGSDSASTPAQYLNGSGLYCGPFGPTNVQAQLTAAQVKNDYDLWRAAMGLG